MQTTSTFLKQLTHKFKFSIISAVPLSLLAVTGSHAQSIYNSTPANATTPHKIVEDTTYRKKHFGRAAIEFGVDELGPFSYDSYIAKKDYAQITWKSVGHNIVPSSWTWDNDTFEENQFGHPYHGNYFFNALRTNGYSFWQSAAAPVVGSYLWETFAENQAPAPNDFINTSFGGIVLGEMTYRLSNKIINNQATGVHRQVSEVIGLLVNPTNGLNRILDGKWGKKYGNSTEHDSTRISAQFDVGYREFNVANNNPFHNSTKGWYAHARILYGVPDEDYKTPFSNIVINAEVGKDDSSALNVISVYGSIIGWDYSMEGKSQQIMVISANYDYIHNASFFYGGESVRLNWLSTYHLSKKDTLSTVFGAGPILLGAVPDPYLYRGRNYDYGSGIGFNAAGTLNLEDKLTFGLTYRGGLIGTISGNKSNYYLQNAAADLSYRLIKRLAVTTEIGYYALQGTYDNYPDRDKRYPYFKAALRYNVNF